MMHNILSHNRIKVILLAAYNFIYWHMANIDGRKCNALLRFKAIAIENYAVYLAIH